jgi:hypothetical protein
MTITVKPFQPFGSRVGKDTVLGLYSRYDPDLVEVLKAAIKYAGAYAGVQSVGGWLPKHGCWFVERAVWPAVRASLEGAGHAVVEQETRP